MHPATATAPGNSRLIEIPKGSTAGQAASHHHGTNCHWNKLGTGAQQPRESGVIHAARSSFVPACTKDKCDRLLY
jgi:hypothetical protein